MKYANGNNVPGLVVLALVMLLMTLAGLAAQHYHGVQLAGFLVSCSVLFGFGVMLLVVGAFLYALVRAAFDCADEGLTRQMQRL